MYKKYLFYILTAITCLSCQRDFVIPVFTDENISDEIMVTYTTAHIDAIFTIPNSSCIYKIIYSENADLSLPKALILKDVSSHQSGDINDLQIGKTYYYKYEIANAINSYYSNVRTFTTSIDGLPIVKTLEITGISTNAAICHGKVFYEGNTTVTEKGICYSKTETDPTLDNSKVCSLTIGEGAYSCLIEHLEVGTTYYVRAYAVNKYGVEYGESKTFQTLK